MTIISDLQLFNVPSLHEMHPFCVELTEWLACTYRFPPCGGFKLLPLCDSDCRLLERTHIAMCGDILADAYYEYSFPLQDIALLSGYDCRYRDSYYGNNFNRSYFTVTNSCYTTVFPDNPSGQLMYVKLYVTGASVCTCVFVCVYMCVVAVCMMYVCMCVCIYVCVYVYMYVCVYDVCMCVCMCMCTIFTCLKLWLLLTGAL